MKTKIIFIITFLALLFTSCEKFLQEDFYSGSSIALQVSTEEGYETLVNACYVTSKVWYGKEYGWDLTTVGTDCWTYAGDADDMRNLALYNTTFNNQWPGRIAVVWAELYKGLNTCNTAIKYTPQANIPDDRKVIREAEIRFLRAFYLWHIVESWGNVAFSNQPVTEPEYEMHRSDVSIFYTQIFEDLDYAVANLPATLPDIEFGRVYKYAALAFRARAHLYWASEYMSGNCFDGKTYDAINGTNHLQQAINDANEVISNTALSLYDNYADVWLMDNNASADKNKENIWAINYSATQYAEMNVEADEYDNMLSGTDPKPFNDREGGNQGHMMFGMRWFAVGGGNTFLKDDLSGLTETEPTRPFCRYMPTKFLIDLYNTDVDQRFYGTFNTVFYANNPDTTNYYRWDSTETLLNGSEYIVPENLKYKMLFGYKDTAFRMYKEFNIPAEQSIVRGTSAVPWFVIADKGYFYLDQSLMYNEDESINDLNTNQRRAYFDLSKWYDYTRPHNGQDQSIIGSQRGKRDFIVFRLPEMYYIASEASLLAGKSGDAYNYLKTLADKRSINGDGAALLAAYGINSGGDLNIDFILDDRARELTGEQQRWFDLKRTGKTLERIRAHNPDAKDNIQAKHIVRPIPQYELDAIQNKEDFESGPGIYW